MWPHVQQSQSWYGDYEILILESLSLEWFAQPKLDFSACVLSLACEEVDLYVQDHPLMWGLLSRVMLKS